MSSFGLQPKCLCPSGYKGLHCEGCSFVVVRTLHSFAYSSLHCPKSAIATGNLHGKNLSFEEFVSNHQAN